MWFSLVRPSRGGGPWLLTIVGGVRDALLDGRLGRGEIVRPRRQWAWVPGPSTSPLEGALVALRCTRRLLRRLRTDVPKEVPDAGNALGHWYATLLTFNRTAYVIAISERSLLSLVLLGAPFGTLVARFPAALAELLHALGVPGSQITTELNATSPLVIAATANRRVLGCLNQYAFELSIHLTDEPHTCLVRRELWLSENISSAIQYSAPREVAMDLLAGRTQ